MDKIIINRSDAIGDLVLTLPMAVWIKRHFPHSKVGLIVRKGNLPIAKLCDSVDEVFEVNQKASLVTSMLSFRKIFREFNPDVYVEVNGNKWGSLSASIFGPSSRYGLKHKIIPWLFLNKGVSQSRSLALMHESEYNISLLNNLLPKYQHEDFEGLSSSLISDVSKYQSAGLKILKEKFPDISSDKKVVMIHPGMTGHSLNWSARNYARLAEYILENDSEVSIIFSYTPGDSEYIETVKNQLSGIFDTNSSRLVFLDGSSSGLTDYINILSNMDCFIGGSTGPTHLAGILGVPFLSIYSPVKTQSAYRWQPLTRGQKFKVINPDVVCGEDRFCAGRRCPYYDCMGKIEVKEVYDQFSLILGDS